VQLEYNDGDYTQPDWKQVARFDTSHGFFHLDLHYADGAKQKYWEFLPQYPDTDEAFNKARAYLVRKSTELVRKSGYVEDKKKRLDEIDELLIAEGVPTEEEAMEAKDLSDMPDIDELLENPDEVIPPKTDDGPEHDGTSDTTGERDA